MEAGLAEGKVKQYCSLIKGLTDPVEHVGSLYFFFCFNLAFIFTEVIYDEKLSIVILGLLQTADPGYDHCTNCQLL